MGFKKRQRIAIKAGKQIPVAPPPVEAPQLNLRADQETPAISLASACPIEIKKKTPDVLPGDIRMKNQMLRMFMASVATLAVGAMLPPVFGEKR